MKVKYSLEYEIQINDLNELSLDDFIKKINEKNVFHRSKLDPKYKGDLIHYELINYEDEEPKSIIVKLVLTYSADRMDLLFDLFYENNISKKKLLYAH